LHATSQAWQPMHSYSLSIKDTFPIAFLRSHYC